ncbi:MAG: hypothetical protein J5755_00200 [Clostridia bacterium]|nr:hypothetical protein [Clostridia bacterium]
MKKLCTLLLAIIFVALTFSMGAIPLASADGEAHYLVGEQAVTFYYYFLGVRYTFQLPQGYTVSLGASFSEGGTTYVEASFAGYEGMIVSADRDKMTLSSEKVALPRAVVTSDINVVFKPDANGNLNDYAPYTSSTTLTYLGTYEYDHTPYYAVQMQTDAKKIYYVAVSNANQEDVERIVHPKAVVVDGGSGDGSAVVGANEGSSKKGFTWVRLLLIIGIIAPLAVILLFIFRPRRRVSRAYRELSDAQEDEDDLDVE